MTWNITLLVLVFLVWIVVIVGLAWDRLDALKAEREAAKQEAQDDVERRQKELE